MTNCTYQLVMVILISSCSTVKLLVNIVPRLELFSVAKLYLRLQSQFHIKLLMRETPQSTFTLP